ncbi:MULTISPECIES: hypothetical protein [Borreliella]|uniref:Uncharacterized protein n=1 Tax=Borreliella garinii PBr TaxID=498743 RepID=B8F1Z8_BORGR|nr:hypothetical protein [Borreliella garinii]ACL34926.1 conserved hypothetical protein [Borreliella garinii PBr]APQ15753.1 hypothetical protein BLA33_05305 [Borreliella garinii]AZA28510.1 hypothetical protein DB281_05670 [Borreliella garinii]
MAKLKKVNIVSSIIAMLIISISGIGTYAFKGLLADIKTQAAKVVKAEVFKELENYYKAVKKEVFKELENYYSAKIKTEFEEMKNSVKEDLKRTTDFINTVNKENLAQEIRNILVKEKIKVEEILREQLRSMKLEKLNE